MKTVIPCLLCLATLAGCGTTVNLFQDRPTFYGGVTSDLSAYKDYCGSREASLTGDLTWTPFLALDIPLSAVADTLTLPYVWLASSMNPAPTPVDWP